MHNKVPFTKFNQDSTVRRTLENKVMVPMMRMKRMLMMTILILMTKRTTRNRMITIVMMVKVLMMKVLMMKVLMMVMVLMQKWPQRFFQPIEPSDCGGACVLHVVQL